MKRLLAEAAVARRASGSKASASGRDTAAAAAAGQKSAAAGAAAGTKDWRLQGPGKRFMPEFKPGGLCWVLKAADCVLGPGIFGGGVSFEAPARVTPMAVPQQQDHAVVWDTHQGEGKALILSALTCLV
jgi:hypothetical protein